MRIIFAVWFIVVLIGAGCTDKKPAIDLEGFNSEAKKVFKSKVDKSLLGLDERGICVLSQVIENDLNDHKTVILFNRFVIRNFHDQETGLDFSFVKDLRTDSMYFVAVPGMEDWVYSSYKHYDESSVPSRINGKVRLVKFKEPLLEKLISESGLLKSNDSRFMRNSYRVSTLYRGILPNYFITESESEEAEHYVDSLHKISRIDDSELRNIKELLASRFNPNTRIEVSNVFNMGYVVFAYNLGENKDDIVSGIYFIPADSRKIFIQRVTDAPNYDGRECSGG